MKVRYHVWRQEHLRLESGELDSFEALSQIWNSVLRNSTRDQIWIDLTDASSEQIVQMHGAFGLDAEALRDLAHHSPVPRMHSFKEYDYVILHRLFYDFESQQCEHRGVAIFRGDRFLITSHQAHLSRLFENLRGLVQGHPEAFLAKGNPRIFLHLLEGLVADYGPILNRWQEELEEIEESILRGSLAPVTERILKFKRLVVTLRKALIPQRQTLVQVYERSQLRSEEESIRPFLKDVSEEISVLIRELDSLSTQAASVFDMYAANLTLDMSRSSHQMNVVMQRLAVVSAIFMPLTFIVGVYGMNIEGMPELKWPGFYFMLLGFMALVVISLLIWFKRKNWY
jgi:magnesium transporter